VGNRPDAGSRRKRNLPASGLVNCTLRVFGSGFLLGLLLRPEDGGDASVRNVGFLLGHMIVILFLSPSQKAKAKGRQIKSKFVPVLN
jgi:hypothetical protein